MEKRFAFSLMAVLLSALVGLAWAQSFTMPGPQTSFEPPRQGLRVFPTPRPSKPQGLAHVLRPMHGTPTPYKPRFYALQPTPHPTPIRSEKKRPGPPGGAATLPGPRKIHYHSLYQDPTPTGSRAVP